MKKLGFEVQDILSMYKADSAVIVSDGEDDEVVIPIVQAIVPILSVQRVIIKQSRSVEYFLCHPGQIY